MIKSIPLEQQPNNDKQPIELSSAQMPQMLSDALLGNCLIAEFMGMERTQKDIGEPTFKQKENAVIWASQLMYKSSWDWLMSVVEKIEKDCKAHITIYNKQCWVEFYGVHDDPCKFHNKEKSTIDNVWLSIVSFIKWYNQQAVSEGIR